MGIIGSAFVGYNRVYGGEEYIPTPFSNEITTLFGNNLFSYYNVKDGRITSNSNSAIRDLANVEVQATGNAAYVGNRISTSNSIFQEHKSDLVYDTSGFTGDFSIVFLDLQILYTFATLGMPDPLYLGLLDAPAGAATAGVGDLALRYDNDGSAQGSNWTLKIAGVTIDSGSGSSSYTADRLYFWYDSSAEMSYWQIDGVNGSQAGALSPSLGTRLWSYNNGDGTRPTTSLTAETMFIKDQTLDGITNDITIYYNTYY